MPSKFNLRIVTPEKVLFSGDVQALTAPATLGYIGILAHHAPYMATLKPGAITIRSADGASTVMQSQGCGYIEVSDNKAVILLDESGVCASF
jgi:F-type H+-transporting ATPase subunit epsilon